ncbi:MAG: CHAT domain-containing protein [Anaerolineales bacterium]|nr:CHAT domain-containing protein [Anaerolineales bacterium]
MGQELSLKHFFINMTKDTMSPEQVAREIVEAQGLASKKQVVDKIGKQLSPRETYSLAKELKDLTLLERRKDANNALLSARAISYLGKLTQQKTVVATGLRIQGVVYVAAFSKYSQALKLYAEAATVCREVDDRLGLALIDMNRIVAEHSIGETRSAINRGLLAEEILMEFGCWREAATLNGNLAILYGTIRQNARALERIKKARQLHIENQGDYRSNAFLPGLDNNLAMAYRNLGRYEESIAISRKTIKELHKLDAPGMLARAKHTLGETLFFVGQFYEGVILHFEAQQGYTKEGRLRDALIADLSLCDGLLGLGSYQEVIETCLKIERQLDDVELTDIEVADLHLKRAHAHMKIGQLDKAALDYEIAHQLYKQSAHGVGELESLSQLARLKYQQHGFEDSLGLIQSCLAEINVNEHPIEYVTVSLVASEIALQSSHITTAEKYAVQALNASQFHNSPELLFRTQHLLGKSAFAQENYESALEHYDNAIVQLELINNSIIGFHRSNFLHDRESVYEDTVKVCLILKRVDRALAYAEQAKSRTLLDLFLNRELPSIQVRNRNDRQLIEELHVLRQESDRLYRELEVGHLDSLLPQTDRYNTTSTICKRIEQLLEQLLIRNVHYSNDIRFWKPLTAPPQQHLDKDTLILEYFAVENQLLLFVVSKESIECQQLEIDLATINQLHLYLKTNFSAVQKTGLGSLWLSNAKAVLSKLHSALIAPIAPKLQTFCRLLIVPHNSLHNLPFHALFDGNNYLIEKHDIAYLPVSSFLTLHRPHPRSHDKALIIGYSYDGALPYAPKEAEKVAEMLEGDQYLESDATRNNFTESADLYDLIYFATHSVFREENSMFSGLALADGWLTVFDIAQLRLNASLVVLNTCNSGVAKIGNGDELNAIAHTFLAVGASTVVSTLWPILDAELTVPKISKGDNGEVKLQVWEQQRAEAKQDMHPFYWAPYIVISTTFSELSANVNHHKAQPNVSSTSPTRIGG